MIRFDDRVAIVTGAGRGIGLGYARALAERGARVVVHDVGVDSSGEGCDPSIAKNAARNIADHGGVTHPATGPIDTREGCMSLVEQTNGLFGRCDILIHNAGWVGYQTIEDLTPEFLSRALSIQLEAPIWLAQAAWPSMKEHGYGRIVLTTSDRAIYSQYAQKGLAAYAAAKISQIGLMNILAVEGEVDGILVNAVSPVAKTRMWGIEDEPDELKPEAVVPGVLYLASEACQGSGWILRASNGQFCAIKWTEAEGVDYPRNLSAYTCHTVDEFAASWGSMIAKAQTELR